MRRSFASASSLSYCFAWALVAGCTGDLPPEVDGGADPDGGVPADAATPMPQDLTYRPDGCEYDVRTPSVIEAARGSDVFGAMPAPDHVHVSWAGAPESTFAINWRSDRETLASSILVGTDLAAVTAADGATAGVERFDGHHVLYRPLDRTLTRIHEAHVCGRDAGTIYHYKVGGPGHWSEVFSTATAPTPGATESFSFAVLGDSRNQVDNLWALAQRRIADRGADFEVFSGDAVLSGVLQGDWDAFFEASDGAVAVGDVLSSIPFMPVNGNHDVLAVPFVAQFALPQEVSDGEVAQGEDWYSLDYGNAHFVFLNDTVDDDAVLAGSEADWLRADLEAVDRTRTPWVFVAHHRATYTCGSTHSPATDLRMAWQPIFDELGVDVVFSGHNHVYERSLPIRGLTGDQGIVAEHDATGAPTIDADGNASGTIYLLSGAAGAPLYAVGSDCPTQFIGRATGNYAIVEIEGRTITVTAYESATDAVIDTFTYTK